MICPTCKRPFLAPAATAAPQGVAGPPVPFCSTRCRAADLGSWLNGDYRITTPGGEDELDRGPDADPEN